jgi:glutamate-1-semialdehyde 2,1-aminomutase
MPGQSRSQELFDKYSSIITGGVHSGFRFRTPSPIYFTKAKGSKLYDADGNEYVDCLVANGACILGHGNRMVTEAVAQQLRTGLTVSLETELSLEVAEMLHKMIPSAEMVKLSNTGTEAVMHAIQIARGFTNKKKLVKTEGGYHGWSDEANISVHPPLKKASGSEVRKPQPESAGASAGVTREMMVVPYNDAAALEKTLSADNDVAAFLVEPVLYNSGCIPPSKGYLEEIREITSKHGVLLIFDEVITGFRMAPGGAQEYYGVTPDLSVFGKAIANGFPLSAVVGSRDVMQVTDPRKGRVSFQGTYNANQPSLAASKACLNAIRDGAIQRKIARFCKSMKQNFDAIASDLNAQVQFQTVGGQFQVYFSDSPVVDYTSAARTDAEKYNSFAKRLFDQGVFFSQSPFFHHGVSAAHSEDDLSFLNGAFEDSLRKSA